MSDELRQVVLVLNCINCFKLEVRQVAAVRSDELSAAPRLKTAKV